MINYPLIIIGKFLSFLVKRCGLGDGSTWPGHIALRVNPKFISDAFKKNDIKIIFVIGTNGKTTTSALIKDILEMNGMKVIHNSSGANLLNGIASTLILSSNLSGKLEQEFAILEVDENAFSQAVKEVDPDFVIALNLFRDQLDRYGEVNTIAKRWKKAIEKLPSETILILNADDPQIAYLGEKARQQIYYFGLSEKTIKLTAEHAADSLFCPACEKKLIYKQIYFSHLGIWNCVNCKFAHPHLDLFKSNNYPLDGIYNKYNVHAALLLSKVLGLPEKIVDSAILKFSPAFGRGETIYYKGHTIRVFLSKNPTGFNQSIETVSELRAKRILIAINDRIADGLDVSWIWDVEFEKIQDFAEKIIVSGDRANDMALRIKYANKSRTQSSGCEIRENYEDALDLAIKNFPANETLYVLATYTAMLDIRKIISGKGIL